MWQPASILSTDGDRSLGRERRAAERRERRDEELAAHLAPFRRDRRDARLQVRPAFAVRGLEGRAASLAEPRGEGLR